MKPHGSPSILDGGRRPHPGRRLAYLGPLLAVAAITGCTALNSVRIDSVPSGAELRVNAKYVGRTPQEVQHVSTWYGTWGTGETLHVVLEKPGYQPFLADITYQDLCRRYLQSDYEAGCKFTALGALPGVTYPYIYKLTAAGGSTTAARKEPSPPRRREPAAESPRAKPSPATWR